MISITWKAFKGVASLFLFIFFLLTTGGYAQSPGRKDVTTLGDYMTQTWAMLANYTAYPYKLFDTTDVKGAINDAAVSVCRDIPGACDRTDTIITVYGQGWYALDSDFVAIEAVTRRNVALAAEDPLLPGTELPIFPESFGEIGTKTMPEDEFPRFYVIQRQRIFLDPVKNGEDTIFVYFMTTPSPLDTVTDTSNISINYSDLVVYRAVRRLTAGRSDDVSIKLSTEAREQEMTILIKLGLIKVPQQ